LTNTFATISVTGFSQLYSCVERSTIGKRAHTHTHTHTPKRSCKRESTVWLDHVSETISHTREQMKHGTKNKRWVHTSSGSPGMQQIQEIIRNGLTCKEWAHVECSIRVGAHTHIHTHTYTYTRLSLIIPDTPIRTDSVSVG
jgi:hypothetical protein